MITIISSGGGYRAPGGDGGPGVKVSPDSHCEVSGVELIGGEGGNGTRPGKDGPPYSGSVDFTDPPYPTLDMQGEIHPGSHLDVIIHGQTGDTVVLLLSENIGWLEIPGRRGPPLSALPGGFFVGVHLGSIGPGGELSVTLAMLNDPIVQGFALTAQAAVLLERSFVLSNVATRIVGE
ncbi:MAG: hypothetical protein AB1486_10915 [Planctomycetota bacterium]